MDAKWRVIDALLRDAGNERKDRSQPIMADGGKREGQRLAMESLSFVHRLNKLTDEMGNRHARVARMD